MTNDILVQQIQILEEKIIIQETEPPVVPPEVVEELKQVVETL